MSSDVFYYQVAVNTHFNGSLLTYRSEYPLEIGTLVKVPMGHQNLLGCVLETTDLKDQNLEALKIKNIEERVFNFTIDESVLRFYQWVASYYHYPLGKLIGDILPRPMKRPKKTEVLNGVGLSKVPLNDDQLSCVNRINSSLNRYTKWLLHGVTGSGKTNVYLHAIQEVLGQGQSVLFLLPEINLTGQFIKTFIDHLDCPIFIYNSSISSSEKLSLWEKLENMTDPHIIIGVRSAIFLPTTRLGLIIVDEEHDQSFKQEDRCPYNARDISIKKASLLNIPVILGSATPSMETYFQLAETDFYLPLKKRALATNLPEIVLVDLRHNEGFEEEIWPFRPETVERIQMALDKREQVLVFMNKLGFADYLQCRACGHHFSCPNCSSNLKFFKSRNEVSCQICSYKDKAPEICPACSSLTIKQIGFGTEKLTSVLKTLFSNCTIERFDRDELTTTSQVEERLAQFHEHKIDILVGTQMLSKGHNFKKVNLVVVMGVDAQLNFPDFRANERAYQLITQVSGRPGRYGEESQVLIQTLNKDNPLFSIISQHEFNSFYIGEKQMREICDCPPYSKLAMLYFTGKNREEVKQKATSVAQLLTNLQLEHFKEIEVLGPRPALVEKRVNKFTWSLMIKSENINQLHNAIKTVKNNYPILGPISLKIDIDPYHLS